MGVDICISIYTCMCMYVLYVYTHMYMNGMDIQAFLNVMLCILLPPFHLLGAFFYIPKIFLF